MATYTPEDFQYGTPARIFGSETEYNIQHMTDDCSLIPYIDRYYIEDEIIDGTDLWLENGARLYIDSGDLVEYATPEVTTAKDLLAHERAGEKVIEIISNGMANELDVATLSGAYKRSGYSFSGIDFNRTAGHHENYLSVIPQVIGTNEREKHPLHRELMSYLSTRGSWAGAGLVANSRFLLTQKQNSISFSGAHKVTVEGNKPAYLIHAGENGFTQLEVRLGDGNMSDWAIATKFAFTSFVLRLIEVGEFPSRLLIKEKQGDRALRSTARLEHVPTESGFMHPAQHQRLIAEACLELTRSYDFIPPEEIEAAYEVATACRQIEQLSRQLEGASLISDRVDWAAKLTYMREKQIDDPTNEDVRAVSIDLMWENIATNGIARKWYKKYQDPIASPEAIESARILPPVTRAMARVAALESLSDNPYSINWRIVNGADGSFYTFNDPWSTEQS